ncbi:hypothetical protein [Nocardiopsis ganjiahuensis]|uniref:hypothetical protein n=1 Tax=Nocardiopsis ganjiahuensis TaxID=239984 RepID=UPI0003490577|nr:hypothetical protein [Nocardiopsis ganjiahuensis]
MRTTMMPSPTALETPITAPKGLFEVTPATLAALDITDGADLFAADLDDETCEERAARVSAAADILDDRLSEIAAQAVTPEVIRGWSV